MFEEKIFVVYMFLKMYYLNVNIIIQGSSKSYNYKAMWMPLNF